MPTLARMSKAPKRSVTSRLSLPSKPRSRSAGGSGTSPGGESRRRSGLTASTADRHRLYELSVQDTEAEIDFVDEQFRVLRGRKAVKLREDFCGTANTCCEWVRRRRNTLAVGLDLDQPTMDWGIKNHVSKLKPAQAKRIRLLQRNVLTPGSEGSGMDIVLAMNFSYFTFNTRAMMREYFEAVRRSLVKDGIFFMDFVGGWECQKKHREVRPLKGFTYVWQQGSFDPITHDIQCSISFRFPDGSGLRKAFTYVWRLWSLPEIRELLSEAGFKKVTVYWEGDDGKGGGDGVFTPAEHGEECASFLCYIAAEK